MNFANVFFLNKNVWKIKKRKKRKKRDQNEKKRKNVFTSMVDLAHFQARR